MAENKVDKAEVLARVKQILIYVFHVVWMVVLDQIGKYHTVNVLGNKTIDIIPDVLQLTYVKNTGAIFGLGQQWTWLFCVLTPICILFIAFLFMRTPKDHKFVWARICLTMIIAGAIGNFIDRLAQGYVVDMIYVKLIDFPVFNIADSYVTVGMFALIPMILFWKEWADAVLSFKK